MRTDPNNHCLAITLDDYGCPPFCSGFYRLYAGTSAEIRDFLSRLSARERAGEYEAGLADAYRRYQAGEREADAGYYMTCARVFYPLVLCRTAHVEQQNWSMDFVNAWRCIYRMRADKVEADVWYTEMEGRYCRFVFAGFQSLAYFDEFIGEYRPLSKVGFWGHPCILGREGERLYSCLAFQEREFAGLEEMEADIRTPTPPDYSGFLFDIFGDG